MFSGSEFPIAKEDQEIMDLVDPSTPLPQWFTEEDLTEYATLYEKSGFCYPLKIPYRSWNEELGITDPKVEVPVHLIMGEKDFALQFPGLENYIKGGDMKNDVNYMKSGDMKNHVPNLQVTFIPQGTHFVHEQFPDQVNEIILKFLAKHVQ